MPSVLPCLRQQRCPPPTRRGPCGNGLRQMLPSMSGLGWMLPYLLFHSPWGCSGAGFKLHRDTVDAVTRKGAPNLPLPSCSSHLWLASPGQGPRPIGSLIANKFL